MANAVIDRITINNILAFLIIGTYCLIWGFTLFYGITTATAEGSDPVIGVISAMEQLASVIGTMTIIVVLVVQFYFRTAPPKPEVS